MSRTLLVMRHAKSDWASLTATDFERPLNARGVQDAPCMGRWLKANQLIPDTIIASPAQRAKETVLAVCAELHLPQERIQWLPLIYEAMTSTLRKVVDQIPQTSQITLLVGHNPGMESLVRFLCADTPLPPDGKLMPTAAIAHIELTEETPLRQGSARLIQLIRPRDVPCG